MPLLTHSTAQTTVHTSLVKPDPLPIFTPLNVKVRKESGTSGPLPYMEQLWATLEDGGGNFRQMVKIS